MAPSYNELFNCILDLPGVLGFNQLRRMGISHLVVHVQPPLRIREVRRWERRHGEGPEPQIEKVYASEDDRIFVYRLLPGPVAMRDGA